MMFVDPVQAVTDEFTKEESALSQQLNQNRFLEMF